MLLVYCQASTPEPPSTPSETSVSMSLDNSRDGGMSPTFSSDITPPVEPFEDESGLLTASSIHITPLLDQLDNLDNSRDGGMSPTFSVEITPPEEPFEDERGLPTASSIPDSHIETLSQRQTDEDQVTHFFEMVRFFLH